MTAVSCQMISAEVLEKHIRDSDTIVESAVDLEMFYQPSKVTTVVIDSSYNTKAGIQVC